MEKELLCHFNFTQSIVITYKNLEKKRKRLLGGIKLSGGFLSPDGP